MISIVKKAKSKNLYVQFYIDGKCIQRSTKLLDTKFNRLKIKREIIPQLEIKIAQGEFNKEKKSKDFNFFSDKYLAQKENLKSYKEWYNIVYNQLIPVFGNRDITSIKKYEIKEFIAHKLKTVSPRRARTLINVISSIFDIAIDYEVISSNPSQAIQLPRHTKKEFVVFSKDEVTTLLETADNWFKNFLAFAFYTGARLGELIALTWNDVDLDNRVISINKRVKKGSIDTPKTKSSIRDIPIFDDLVPYIRNQMKESKHVHVFVNPKTDKMFYGTEKLKVHWVKLLEECDMPYNMLYSTRHTFITTMLKTSKLNMIIIAQIVGHSNTSMIVKNYAKFIKGEHLNVDRDISLFTDKITDSSLTVS